jgi:retinol dehydrogenase-12
LFSQLVAQVFIVTGLSSGVGKELAQILYAHDAKVYVAARSKERAGQVVGEIRASFLASKGELIYLHLDLEDSSAIKASAEEFLGKEDRLDVLWNNAAVMNTPVRSKGYIQLQLGTSNIAPFLFTKLLTPILVETAKTAPKGSVRVVWMSSSAAEMIAPVGGVDVNNLDYKDLSG